MILKNYFHLKSISAGFSGERKEVGANLIEVLRMNLPKGFEESINKNGIGFNVPHLE